MTVTKLQRNFTLNLKTNVETIVSILILTVQTFEKNFLTEKYIDQNFEQFCKVLR